MSREIKFRAWLKTKKKMIDMWWYDGCYILERAVAGVTVVEMKHHRTDSILMQFTGFKDKNGKEIYDMDIIGDWTDVDGKMEQSKQTVYFDDMLGQWMLDNSLKQDKTISYSLFSELHDFEYEIIGNVFENTDLLPT